MSTYKKWLLKKYLILLKDLDDGYILFSELTDKSQNYIMRLVHMGYSNGAFLDRY